MKVIAITIESTRAIFYSLEKHRNETIGSIAEDLKSIAIADDYNSAEMREFKEKAFTFFDRVKPDRIVILKRMTKGKFAAGSVSFKLEGVLQCYEAVDIEFVAPTSLKAFYKKNEFTQNPVHKYQLNAAQLAQYVVMVQ
ncbi:MAG: DUF3010 family protein [Prolixibacteraceae bacterium]